MHIHVMQCYSFIGNGLPFCKQDFIKWALGVPVDLSSHQVFSELHMFILGDGCITSLIVFSAMRQRCILCPTYRFLFVILVYLPYYANIVELFQKENLSHCYATLVVGVNERPKTNKEKLTHTHKQTVIKTAMRCSILKHIAYVNKRAKPLANRLDT